MPRAKRFTLFPKLPPEIRSMIWRFAELNRILTANPYLDPAISIKYTVPFQVHQPQRLLSRVSRESRSETNKDYIHLKASGYRFLKNDIFLNPDRDTIYFPEETIKAGKKWVYFLGEILERGEVFINKIAVDGIILDWAADSFVLKVIHQLDEISFVVAGTKKATRVQVFTFKSDIKINRRRWG